MFFGQIEREILGEEIYTTWRHTTIPEDLQLIIVKGQEEHDIWGGYTANNVKPVDNSQNLMKNAQRNKIPD